MNIQLTAVAVAHTPFKEKFAIPRQPALAPAAVAEIELLPPFNQAQALDGLEQSSHIWLIFQFHQTLAKVGDEPRLCVRPPRLGGNDKLGVFATRSTHRPNSLGQSAVKLERIEGTVLTVSGIDLLDGTPILDIKPYIPYADSLPEAVNQIAAEAPETIEVIWEDQARLAAEKEQQRLDKPLMPLIEQCLAQDPRPAYQQLDTERVYGTVLWGVDVTWQYLSEQQLEVVGVTKR